MQSQNTPRADERFHELYQELATAWDSHQDLRSQDVPIAMLSQSAFRLYDARGAMWGWWQSSRPDRNR